MRKNNLCALSHKCAFELCGHVRLVALVAILSAFHAVSAMGASSPDRYLTETTRGESSRITPYYFGPNAFAIPDMLYRVSPDLYVEIAGDYYPGRRGDRTYDMTLKANIPLWTRRANLSLWLPVKEWYDNTVENMLACNVNPENYANGMKGSLAGDVYVSMDMQILEEKRHAPDIALRAALKTASGGGYDVARYYDSAGYFFDLGVSKSFLVDKASGLRLRVAGQGGFLCWQTGTARQNDAVMFGALLGVEWKGFRLRETFGGYWGWETGACSDGHLAHDFPMSLKTDVSYRIKRWEVIAQFQHGLKDYPYNQYRIGVGYHFDILGKK